MGKSLSTKITILSKRKHERAIFEAFLNAEPQFSGETLRDWCLPENPDEFPDVVCKTSSGRRIGVELGEWLNEEEMREAKGMERIQSSILLAIGDQGTNTTDNILFLWLRPRAKARIKPNDIPLFRKQLFSFIAEVDRQWPSEPSWHNPPGRDVPTEKLSDFAILQKYLGSIRFFPRMKYEGWPPNGKFVKKTWPIGQDWIVFPCRGGSFDQNSMLQPLFELVARKKERYGGHGTGFESMCLIVYCNSALIYNSPAECEPFFTFQDAANSLREFVGDDAEPFHHIFLFVATNGGQVFEVV